LKISVVTVAYNAAATIGDTIRSVAAQTGVEVEHLIVDGASADGTADLARTIGGAHVRVLSEPDQGLYDAMNKGLALASGEAVGFLNADDFYCRTDALALVAGSLANPSADAVSGSVAIVDPADAARVVRGYGAASFRPWMLRFGHMPPHPGFYARLAAARLVGEYDVSLRQAADFDWLARFYAVRRLRALVVPATLVAMRAGGVSQRGLAAVARANAEIGQSLARHRLGSVPPLVWLKYAAKAWQLAAHPSDFPAPGSVRWPPAAADSKTLME
jgi:glycosyltransferase involved in cell wall biosynthesis